MTSNLASDARCRHDVNFMSLNKSNFPYLPFLRICIDIYLISEEQLGRRRPSCLHRERSDDDADFLWKRCDYVIIPAAISDQNTSCHHDVTNISETDSSTMTTVSQVGLNPSRHDSFSKFRAFFGQYVRQPVSVNSL